MRTLALLLETRRFVEDFAASATCRPTAESAGRSCVDSAAQMYGFKSLTALSLSLKFFVSS
jgi:hypothetical protein